MLRSIAAAAAAIALFAGVPAAAAPCKDAKTGRFVKCPEKAKTPARCKDAKGKFAKCGSTGAKPV